MYILIKTRQSEGFILSQCILGNFQYGEAHNMWNVRIVFIDLMEGEQIFVKSIAGLVCVYKNTVIECHVQV